MLENAFGCFKVTNGVFIMLLGYGLAWFPGQPHAVPSSLTCQQIIL